MNENLNAQQRKIAEEMVQMTPDSDAPIIVGLDIGTTKIAAIAGRKNKQGKLEILGFGHAPSNGVQHGQVLNIDQTMRAINAALENCRTSNPDLDINEVYVGIAGHHIKSLQTRGDIVRQNAELEIQRVEIEQLIDNQRKTFIPAGDQIIDVIPQDFYVDNFQFIKDPVGFNGVKVGANFHIITGDRNAIRNINRAVERSGLKTKDLVLQPLASSSAVLCDMDMEAGVAVLDIGGGTSDLAVFYEGVLKHTAVIPFGGENITHDIRLGLGVLKQQAEAMKKQFGSALTDEAKANAFITIPGLRGLPPREISVKNLANIIQARMTEILEFVTYHLKQVGLDNRKLNGGIILTGGGAQLKHLKQLTEFVTGLNARIGYPNEHLAPNHIEQLKSPIYSTCLGLILKGYSDYETHTKVFAGSNVVKHPTTPILTTQGPDGQTQTTEPVSTQQPEHTQSTATDDKPAPTPRPARKIMFWEKFKNNLIDLFKEEEDQVIR
ncbi:cell division protein FtsA [Arachidicoccus rhizosphaerae]|jgi:cell division protein FtsA|uniref:Cell division protein FtsA n=1 Tax=Arachidicoccus rhizosphaerae TaxID=551991 RepID=A0A1H3XZK6_9BACT|nr:cell division protein FtsA [Arachidicoccus rhizosphaerae]SEA04905.1 cell division protein FtsA [Arachidicoccus rhizosphaerae]